MGISVIRGCSGDGAKNSCRTFKLSFGNGSRLKSGNETVIMGSIVLTLITCFVGACGGKPFHPVGQAEVEEDTTQGSLKEKFPESLALALTQITRDDSNEDELWSNAPFRMNGQGMEHGARHPNDMILNGMVEKRSRGIGGASLHLPYSGDLSEDLENGYLRQRPTRLSSSSPNNRPVYDQDSSPPAPSTLASSSGEIANPKVRIQQRLQNLRNQWMAFVGPYSYRKRQILYRQCFFNPISCF